MMFLKKLKGYLPFIKTTPQNASRAILKNTPQNAAQPFSKKKPLTHQIIRQHFPAIKMELMTWKQAIQSAKNPLRPYRQQLHTLYEWTVLDGQVFSQMRTARITVKKSAFKCYTNDKEDKVKTKLLKKTWFYQYLQHAIDAEFYGHSLIEFDPKKNEQGEFKKVMLVPREHVRPESQELLLRPYDEMGIKYNEKPFNKWLIEVGEPTNLGLLLIVSLEYIYKSQSRGDWGVQSEKFGNPFVVLNTASRDAKELDAKENMLANFGNNLWAILDDEDKISLVQSMSSGYMHNSYKDAIELADNYISKIINGQTGTADEKAWVGSAEVHERILSDYGFDRLTNLQAHINDTLIPFLIGHGYPLQGVEFRFVDLEEKDQSNEAPPPKKPTPKDEVPTPAPSNPAPYPLEEHYGNIPINRDDQLNRLIEQAARKAYDQQEVDIDEQEWVADVQKLWDGIKEGFDADPIDMGYADPRFELMQRFEHNIQIFSAFKGHAYSSLLIANLKAADGSVRSFNEFKSAVAPIVGRYRINWLQAEYQHAIASSQGAERWLEFEANKDLFPLLTYTTQADDRVRPSHQELDGITLPVDHEFWDSFQPPIDWGCRCIMRQVDEIPEGGYTPKDSALPSREGVPTLFRSNPAKTGEIFNQSHHYFEGWEADVVRSILFQKNVFAYGMTDTKRFKQLYFNDQTGGYVVAHKSHDTSLTEAAAQALADQGAAVRLLKRTPTVPHALTDGRLWAFESVDSNQAIQDAIESAKAQRVVLVLDGDLSPDQIEIPTNSLAAIKIFHQGQILDL